MELTENIKKIIPGITEKNVFRAYYKYAKQADEKNDEVFQASELLSLLEDDFFVHHEDYYYYTYCDCDFIRKESLPEWFWKAYDGGKFMVGNDEYEFKVPEGACRLCRYKNGEFERVASKSCSTHGLVNALLDLVVETYGSYQSYDALELAFIEQMADDSKCDIDTMFKWHDATCKMYSVHSFYPNMVKNIKKTMEMYDCSLRQAFITYLERGEHNVL